LLFGVWIDKTLLRTSICRAFPLKTVCSRNSDLTKGSSPLTSIGTSFVFHVLILSDDYEVGGGGREDPVLRCPVQLLFQMAELPLIIVAAGLLTVT
jgi:hypothetical protein